MSNLISKSFLQHNILQYIPIILTAVRLALAFTFPIVSNNFRILFLFISSLTEFLDGVISKKLKKQRKLEMILDPMGDKVFFFFVIFTFFFEDMITLNQLILISVRDLAVVWGGVWILIIKKEWEYINHLKPNIYGKATTVLHYATFFSLLMINQLFLPLFVITCLISIVAAFSYIRNFFKKIRKNQY